MQANAVCLPRNSECEEEGEGDEKQEEEILGSDNDEQEDPKDYCTGLLFFCFNYYYLNFKIHR